MLSFLKELIKLRPNDAAIIAVIGSLAQSKGDVEQARRYYQTAVNLEPANVTAFVTNCFIDRPQ
jgi:Flp pilus assembly protein TadD